MDPEGAYIAQLVALARAVLAKAMRKQNVQAARIILEHYEAKPSISATIHGPVILTWASSPSPIPIAHSRESSTTPGDDNGHGPQSSSVTDSLESL